MKSPLVGLLVLIVEICYYPDQLSKFLLELFTAPKAAIASTLFVSSI
ncbi:MAG: hypothetical protein KME12_04870 [Trichocoleus desertorum ATA4-8-CV12]|nr:hypothetical protein [Trichocoleus desertorum ATA4-8-CV12]